MTIESLTPPQKVAILLSRLPDDDAAAYVKRLDEANKHDVIAALVHLETIQITEDIYQQIQEENQARLARAGAGTGNPRELANKIMETIHGADGKLMVSSLGQSSGNVLSALSWINLRALAQRLRYEHPQVIAAILIHLPPEQIAKVMLLLSNPQYPNLKADVTLRMMTMGIVRPWALKLLNEGLTKMFGDNKETGAKAQVSNAKIVASFLTHCDKSTSQHILSLLQDKHKEKVDKVIGLMFTFEDLLKLDSRGIGELLKHVDKKDLPKALKNASPEILSQFLKSMSQRAGEMFQEELETLGPITRKDQEAAQRSIVETFKKLEAAGTIVVPGKEEEESDETF